MIPKYISVTWVKPKGWGKLTTWIIDEEIIINGYKIRQRFISNGGNIPWGLRSMFNPVGEGFPAYIAHDQRCDDGDNRKRANKQLYRDLRDCGVSRAEAKAVYAGVKAYAKVMRIK